MSAGKSKSLFNPFGIRRTFGRVLLVPKSLRRQGKRYLTDCTIKELIEVSVVKERRINIIDIEEDRRK